MKKYLFLLLFIPSLAYADVNNPLNFRESDGSPDTYPYQINVSNGNLTDNGDGTITITTGSSTPSGSDLDIQLNDNGSFFGEGRLRWYKGTNTLVISQDSGQTGEAIRISSDTGTNLANISHDGSAYFNTLQVSGAVITDTSVKSPFFSSSATDAAGSGVLRLGNADVIAWEASPAGTDQTIGLSTSEIFVISNPVRIDDSNAGDSEAIRLDNNEGIAWEVNPAGTDYTFKVDTSNILQASGAFNATGAVTSGGKLTANANIDVANGATTAGVLALFEDSDDGTNKATFNVPTLAADTAYILPPDDGDAGEQLQTNGSGTLTWEASGGSAQIDLNFPVQSAKLSADNEVRIDAGLNGGATPFVMWRLLFADRTNNPSMNIGTWQGRVPDNYSGGALTAKIDYIMISSDSTSTSAGSITFGVSVWAITSGDAVSMTTESFDTENSKTQEVPTVMSRDATVSIPLTNADSIAAGDWFMVKLRRNGADSITGDAAVISFLITE